ncbi:formyltetrahydrofolate deformylase [Corynebacterium guangdongense]|uniref:Formyltetrahydrofolate deformylase n=1 Tax=Corynebacterium guangdongense TaxID=1783348 RepID=A0ABU2A0Y5_9CORY|nr:formyltetrahydrofolate deformylase [Corynebacterium guangdongense]MDR7330848.1 formyltetrahydrofolate deformylase [Corynebacterium guangdongense]WJZ16863.1 Formyltetrahydrofolate deformylase [Corynebacterium guangdongense]
MNRRHFVLNVICPDRTGIVAELSGFVSAQGGWVDEADFFTDDASGKFFARLAVRTEGLEFEAFKDAFGQSVAEDMEWRMTDTAVAKKSVILVTREGHCLHDLLGRVRSGDYPMDVQCVIGNHEDLRPIAEAYVLPFHFVPFPKDAVGKREAFDKVAAIVDPIEPDAIVLAKFMQILPPDLCEKWAGRAINIHHSFLPSFMGARPYHQAYTRGVKQIGATCHYATTDLDDGPIIEQDVIRVNHKYTPDDLRRIGRDAETLVLARGLRWHLEDRVMVYGNRTVIFN